MPSKRKRIGYLPSINAQETITKIANKEKISQSKVVGLLVEEALTARGGFDLQDSKDIINKNLYGKNNNTHNSSVNHTDLDELISDRGIIYNKKKYNYNSKVNLTETTEIYNEELFEQFKQFILFQKTTQHK